MLITSWGVSLLPPMMEPSTGLVTHAPKNGSLSTSSSRMESGMGRRLRPASSHSSADMTPLPPVPPPTSRFTPVEAGIRAKATRVSSRSSMLSALTTPIWRHIASHTSLAPASEPVCDDAMLVPARVLPPFSSTTGLRRDA